MPREVYVTDHERVIFLRTLIPSLVRAERLREDFWELVFDAGEDNRVSINLHISSIKIWSQQEGFPKQWAKQSNTEVGRDKRGQ